MNTLLDPEAIMQAAKGRREKKARHDVLLAKWGHSPWLDYCRHYLERTSFEKQVNTIMILLDHGLPPESSLADVLAWNEKHREETRSLENLWATNKHFPCELLRDVIKVPQKICSELLQAQCRIDGIVYPSKPPTFGNRIMARAAQIMAGKPSAEVRTDVEEDQIFKAEFRANREVAKSIGFAQKDNILEVFRCAMKAALQIIGEREQTLRAEEPVYKMSLYERDDEVLALLVTGYSRLACDLHRIERMADDEFASVKTFLGHLWLLIERTK
jgi:hypothetical protein